MVWLSWSVCLSISLTPALSLRLCLFDCLSFSRVPRTKYIGGLVSSPSTKYRIFNKLKNWKKCKHSICFVLNTKQEEYYSKTSVYRTSVFRTSGFMFVCYYSAQHIFYLLFYYSVQFFTLKKLHLLGLFISLVRVLPRSKKLGRYTVYRMDTRYSTKRNRISW